MRILLIAEKYPPIVGGGETHVQQLAEGLVEHGHEVTVLTEAVPPGSERDRYRSGKVTVRETTGLVAACQKLDCKDAMESLHAEIKGTNADVIHVFNYIPALMVAWLRPTVTAKLAVSLFETFVPGVRVFDMWNNWELERALQRGLVASLHPDLHLCGSEAYLRWLREAGFTEPARVVEFGTDLSVFHDDPVTRTQWRSTHGFEDDPLFLVAARPVPRKRIEDAISALADVRRTHPRARLVLTAPSGRTNTEYVQGLRTLAAKLGVDDHVHWVEDTSWQEMPALYCASDAVVLPSSHEGWGIALNEAMASRRPVITTDVEGHDEVIHHDHTGLLYPPGDVSALSQAMRRVLDTDVSALVDEAHRRVRQRFSSQAMVEGHARAYADLVSGEVGR
ncbi:glycosyltransferase involved in cell wall biosynthesis [Streptomyces sp. B3I7]|uniref:glycosyltransferase family 4 protein n=1 Tax=unclassified Streptomyces TaxID=2593676 RepID=UPI002781FF63|nr:MULTISPECIES: glycosyltransferase family 4 protein [unclassified Streptomyces]MDQ0790764.1 glycosyltransferase involved in cell wall biosynthesis [Streptomyces sp. B3I8]MDQ0809498.1 glycosyltransferase involved in cell wall biosynthesis [Streptomyces sp. B3I7]